MAYQIQELDPVRELSQKRKGIEFCIVFAVVFLAVRFGGWHHDMDPLGDLVHPSTWLALGIAALASTLFVLWHTWYVAHSSVPRPEHDNDQD